MPSHDTMVWTWTAPGGEVFKGSADYIDGCRAGWEARAWTVPAAAPTADELAAVPWEPEKAFVRPRCKFSATCEHAHPDDTTTHTNGDVW